MSHSVFRQFNETFEHAGPYAKATLAGAMFFTVLFAGYFLTSQFPHDAFGYVWGRDFAIFWLVGHSVVHDLTGTLYHFQMQQQLMHQLLGSMPAINWGYPPYAVWGLLPFGALPYFPALFLWSGIGLGLYLFAGQGCGGRGQLCFLLFSPAVAICLLTGQNGLWTAILLIGTLYLLDPKPVLAGILLGLLCFKPHLGFLFPLALALSRRWKCFLSAASVFALQVLVTRVVFGPALWQAYFGPGLHFQYGVLSGGSGMLLDMGPTAFFNARWLGLSPDAAWAIQLPFLCLAVVAVVWTFYRRRNRSLSQAVLITALFVGSPYMQVYDMVVMGWVIASLKDKLTAPWDIRLMFAVWWLPVLCIVFGLLRLPLAAPLMAAFLLRLVWHLKKMPSHSWNLTRGELRTGR